MNMNLFTSNLCTSVRNLLKYKTQNIITILCLAVGIICFAVTCHFIIEAWKFNYIYGQDDKCTGVWFFENDDCKMTKALDDSEYQRLIDMKPSSIDQVLFNEHNYRGVWSLNDLDGKKWELVGDVFAVSPDYLRHYGYRSAITGKPISRLKSGTILMSDGLWRKTMGEGTNPIGWNALWSPEGSKSYSGPIIDVVCSNMGGKLDGMMIVSDSPFLVQSKEPIFNLSIVLADGKTRDNLYSDLASLYPDRFVFVRAVNDGGGMVQYFIILVLIFFLGSSVLIIGATGFLKMQLQLFNLRSREIALRRCVGANLWQLFALLAIEVLIVFLITALIALGLTTVIADYVLPILYAVTKNALYVDMDILYQREIGAVVFTALLTLVIAFFAVRRILRAPLGMTAGRSNSISHAGRSAMLIVQYVVCILFLMFILGARYYIKDTASSLHVPDDASCIKQCMMTDSKDIHYITHDEIASLPSVEYVGCINVVNYLCHEEIDTTLYVNYTKVMNEDNSLDGYIYSIAWANEAYFLAMGIHPVAECNEMDSKRMIPVFARPQDADRMERTLQSKGTHRENKVLMDGRTYVNIGYVPIWPNMFSNFNLSYIVVLPEMYIYDEHADLTARNNAWNNAFHYILRPKAHCYEKLVEELNDTYHKKRPGYLMPLDITNVYDKWFADVQWLDMLLQCCWLFSIVSLVCIILSVYSAVSIDTRGREKEVAIRKIHGAKVWNIICLFGRYYLRLFVISAVISVPIGIGVYAVVMKFYMDDTGHNIMLSCVWMAVSLIIVALITLFTVGEKIFRVSKTSPIKIIMKE